MDNVHCSDTFVHFQVYSGSESSGNYKVEWLFDNLYITLCAILDRVLRLKFSKSSNFRKFFGIIVPQKSIYDSSLSFLVHETYRKPFSDSHTTIPFTTVSAN